VRWPAAPSSGNVIRRFGLADLQRRLGFPAGAGKSCVRRRNVSTVFFFSTCSPMVSPSITVFSGDLVDASFPSWGGGLLDVDQAVGPSGPLTSSGNLSFPGCGWTGHSGPHPQVTSARSIPVSFPCPSMSIPIPMPSPLLRFAIAGASGEGTRVWI